MHCKKSNQGSSVMNLQQNRLEWRTPTGGGVPAGRALAIGLFMAAITWVSAPMVVAQDPQRQMAELEQKVKATHLSLKSEAKLITALQEAVSNQASEISALLATVSNQTSQIVALQAMVNSQTNQPSEISALQATVSNQAIQVVSLQAMVNSQTNQISVLDETIGNQAQQLGVLTNLFANFSRDGSDIYITAANLHIVNGLDSTDTTNSLGNLIVGYNELRGAGDDRSGSHNVVIGSKNNFNGSGGFVVGLENSIGGSFPSVSGGASNTVSGIACTVSGGYGNAASGDYCTATGGTGTGASGTYNWSGGCGMSCQY
jgi:hypothetical protein